MKRALIGYTGFVGSNLRRCGHYTELFNSSNFREMAGQRFDEVVCAGVSAVKWLANKEPERDWKEISALLDVLAEVETPRFTLISTIDVYPDPARTVDEFHVVAEGEGQPYGRHRRAIERFVAEQFDDVLVARLPALFGTGLKKNVIYDLLVDNQTDKINPAAVFQWYPLDRLEGDLARARAAGLTMVNLFPEPVATADILASHFPDAIVGAPVVPAPHYRLGTAHAELFGETSPYIMSNAAVREALDAFIEAARRDPETMLA
ncbi:NAD-dependent epimerase/dehydratase family protein [Pelagibacterium luteolum]|uniref:NAD-dependent epimerase/dehydratase domain-containing protein n=1 Tax=Pelagibacterium luteolum TaxID=440168 RepID=A0A1G7XW28_9HYPH|nr:NAD-dependent epimerase/dehydratase family protein [Pelagibacterium luteolum]SDG88273.1 hypothetical protein SAMN04487974_11130 [Pelagibacterium luteolum]